MKIGARIGIPVVGFVLAVLVVAGFFLHSSRVALRQEMYAVFDRGGRCQAAAIGAGVRDLLAGSDAAGLKAYLERSLKDDPGLTWVEVAFGERLSEKHMAGDPSRGPARTFTADVTAGGSIVARVTIRSSIAGIEKRLRALMLSLVLGGMAALGALLVALAYVTGRLVSRPLAAISRSARAIADGNLSAKVPVGSDDELGRLAGDFNLMSAALREAVAGVRATSSGIGELATGLAAIAGRISSGAGSQTESVLGVSSSIEEMNATIKTVAGSVDNLFTLAEGSAAAVQEMTVSIGQVAGNMDNLSQSVEQTAASTSQMSASIQSVAVHVESLTGLITETSSSIAEMDYAIKQIDASAGEALALSDQVTVTASRAGQEALGKAITGMDVIRQAVQASAGVINDLADRSQDISTIISVINEVNSQTNLLALNAAIIAAQSGESGRAFAVVADEIRELSARTVASTAEITSLITGVQSQARNATTAMDGTLRSVADGVRLMEDVRVALLRAVEDSRKSSEASQLIARATAEQTGGVRQISLAAQKMTLMAQEISRATREQTEGSALISSAADSMRDLALQVRKATSEQALGARQIHRASEETSAMAQTIRRATREEAQGSELILANMERIQAATQTNQEGVARLNEMVRQLADRAEMLRERLDRFRIAE